VTAIAGMLSRESRARLLERVQELDELDDLMKRPGLLASPGEPPALHGMGHKGTDRKAER
jgi:hypothetical protein